MFRCERVLVIVILILETFDDDSNEQIEEHKRRKDHIREEKQTRNRFAWRAANRGMRKPSLGTDCRCLFPRGIDGTVGFARLHHQLIHDTVPRLPSNASKKDHKCRRKILKIDVAAQGLCQLYLAINELHRLHFGKELWWNRYVQQSSIVVRR